MTEVTEAARMPFAATSARFVMTLQVAFAVVGFSLYGFAIITGGLFELAPILYFAIGVAFIVLLGRLAGRWHSRLRRVRWATVALEIVIAMGLVVVQAVDPGLSVGGLIGATVCPAAVVVLTLVPATGRWFDR
ncbi:hypothetical protein [Nonomuraea cavernae]|uniref:Uncharacterized protein n=1 Tax=Nonomuraea cavernae TaxID=2045107 RepID=A0A917YYK1_9ACTN|nr:hypothetical protein [Nonomuraea cavernae]MCA2186105.1 hypothetical protein [Nonomuraea cavernae]GGO70196.1 hypothetical protein GCM10012289_33080 [Nonomuraea cavernae]